MTAPSERVETGPAVETRLRETIRGHDEKWPEDQWREALEEAIEGYAQILTSPAYAVLECPDEPPETADADDLFFDLRPSEARALRELAQIAIDRSIVACEAVIVEELVAAARRFASMHPEAVRQRQPVEV